MAMNKLVWSLSILGTLALATSACSVGYIYERYGATAPAIVTVGCHSSYEVFENLRDRTIMVRTNAGASIAGLVCTDDLPPGTPSSRLERAVDVHFANTNRPKCRITERRELSPIHSEFSYVCPS
jgi:hypothetical protein